MSIKEQLIAAAKPKPFPVTVEAWGGEKVHLMPIDRPDFREYEAAASDEGVHAIDVIISMVIHHLVYADGERVFDLNDEGDLSLAESFDLAGYYELWDALSGKALGKLQSKTESTKKNLSSARRKRRP